MPFCGYDSGASISEEGRPCMTFSFLTLGLSSQEYLGDVSINLVQDVIILISAAVGEVAAVYKDSDALNDVFS